MATVQKRGKKWYAVYKSISGKWKQQVGYKDKSETLRLAQRLEDEARKVITGDIDPKQEARKIERAKAITDHINNYKAHLQAKGSSQNHVAYTIADIEKLVTFGAVKNAAEIAWNLVDRWVLSLKKGEAPDSPRTVNRRVGSVKAFLKHLVSQGALAEYTLLKYPKQRVEGTDTRISRALSREEAALLLKSAPLARREVYHFALRTGFRYSEIASMTPSSFDFEHKTITVRASDAKNKHRDQTVPMHSDLVDTLKKMCEGKQPDAQVFNMPTKRDAATLVTEDAKTVGIGNVSDLTFHGLRHTFITLLAKVNTHPKVLQTLARHSDLETTLRYYTHFLQTDERAAIESL